MKMEYKARELGVSFTASWAWGVSLGIGHSILYTKGLLPFSIWALFNTFSLLFFGWFIKKNPKLKQITDNKLIKTFLMVTLVYAIWINTRIMADYFNEFSQYPALWAGLISAAIIVLTFIGKFKFSVISDQWQYLIMILGLLLAFIIGVNSNVIREFELIKDTGTNNIIWAFNMGLGLLVAPFHNAMYYQREEYTKSMRPYYIHLILFAFYMLLVGLTGVFNSLYSTIIINIIIIAISTSSIDSAVAAMQYLIKEKLTIIICILVLAFWPISRTASALKVWEIYQIARIFIILPIIIYYWRAGNGQRY
jgi:hypothetical protein